MASPCKRLCLVVLLLGCVLQAAQGEKWRGMAKMVRPCPGPLLAVQAINLNLTPKNRGTSFRMTADVIVVKNVTLTKARVNVYKSGGIQNLLFLTWTFEDLCERIMKGHHFIDPLFAPAGLPRQCSFSAEKWRTMAKLIRRCPGPPLAVEMLNVNLTPKNRGTTFRITAQIIFNSNITVTKARINIYKDGGIQNVLFLTWTFEDACSKIMKGHYYVDPIFAPGALPRQCSFSAGTYPVIIDYDLHGDMVGMRVRGDFIVDAKVYDQDEMIWCANGYINVRKDTLN